MTQRLPLLPAEKTEPRRITFTTFVDAIFTTLRDAPFTNACDVIARFQVRACVLRAHPGD
jgi:hypothetical protein